MTWAVVSDVHGNLSALEAVTADLARRGVTDVVHAGDLALIGARPAEVVDCVRERGWPGVVGNTDELLWDDAQYKCQLAAAPALEPLLRLLFETYAPVTRERLGPERVDWLAALPREYRRDDAVVVHASPSSLWRAPMPDADGAALVAVFGGLCVPLVVYGHIHRPFVRQCEGFTVANAGSVGLAWDGDARASYLLVESGVAQIVRVEYDVEAELEALRGASYPDAPRIARMLVEGRFVPVGGGDR